MPDTTTVFTAYAIPTEETHLLADGGLGFVFSARTKDAAFAGLLAEIAEAYGEETNEDGESVSLPEVLTKDHVFETSCGEYVAYCHEQTI